MPLLSNTTPHFDCFLRVLKPIIRNTTPRCLRAALNLNSLFLSLFIACSLPPSPQVIFATTSCSCPLCNHNSSISASGVWDGTENVSSIQTLQLAVLQLHRDLQRTARFTNNTTLTEKQGVDMHNQLGARIVGVAEDLERVNHALSADVQK